MAEPIRTCVGCRQRAPKRTLLRFVITPAGVLSLDTTGKKPGRGGYVCSNLECIEVGLNAKKLQRALRSPINENHLTVLKSELLQHLKRTEDPDEL